MKEGRASFSPTFLQGASIFRVLIPEGLGEASGAGLAEAQTTNIGEEVYRVWSVPNLASRASLEIELIRPSPTIPMAARRKRRRREPTAGHRHPGVGRDVALFAVLLSSLRRRTPIRYNKHESLKV